LTAKEALDPLRTIDNEINSKLALRSQYKKILDALTQDYLDQTLHSTDYAADRVQSDPQKSRVESIAVQMADSPSRCAMIKRLRAVDDDIDRQVDILVTLKTTAEALINTIADSRYKDLLRYRYINNWKWESISDAMKIDIRWVYRLHGYALQAYDKIRH
jgi:hypothetical protein